MAYEVAKKREGIYVLMYFNGEPAVEAEVSRLMKINEDVMRYIIVRAEPGQVAAAKERASRPAAPKPIEVSEPAVEAEVAAEAPVAEETASEAPAEAEAAPAEEPAAE